MENSYWFKHDYDACNDELILELRAIYKAEAATAYGMFWVLLEAMVKKSSTDLSINRLNGIAENWRVDVDWLKGLVENCIHLKLFLTDGEHFTSSRLQQHKSQVKHLKDKRSEAAKARWDKHLSKSNASALQKQCKSNADKIRLDKIRLDIMPANVPFADFWISYGKKRDKAECLKIWASLTDQDRLDIMAHIPKYKTYQPDEKFRKDPVRYLKKKSWLDEMPEVIQDQPQKVKLRF